MISDPPSPDFSKPNQHSIKKRFCKSGSVPSKAKTVLTATYDAKSAVEKCIKQYSQQCCAKKCLWTFTLQQVIEYHEFYARKSASESSLWLQNLLCAATKKCDTSDVLLLTVDKKPVCHTAFKTALWYFKQQVL